MRLGANMRSWLSLRVGGCVWWLGAFFDFEEPVGGYGDDISFGAEGDESFFDIEDFGVDFSGCAVIVDVCDEIGKFVVRVIV